MKCERCSAVANEETAFRVRSEIIDLKVCLACAMEAKALNLSVESPALQPARNSGIAA